MALRQGSSWHIQGTEGETNIAGDQQERRFMEEDEGLRGSWVQVREASGTFVGL